MNHQSPILTICIPTYNRREKIVVLVKDLLSKELGIEVRVHVDGSTDGTLKLLQDIQNPLLYVSYSENSGRASALERLVTEAKGQFVMIFDDDDWFIGDGAERVLADCKVPLPETCAGYIYLMKDSRGNIIGGKLPTELANFVSLRADLAVKGDRKEVVRTSLFKKALVGANGRYRRIPTSLYWARIAYDYDVICKNIVVGGKDYLDGGMTSSISSLKMKNSFPIVMLNVLYIRLFFKGRYNSAGFLVKSLARVCYYGMLSGLTWIKSTRQ